MYRATILYKDGIKRFVCFKTEEKVIYEDENTVFLGNETKGILKGTFEYILIEKCESI